MYSDAFIAYIHCYKLYQQSFKSCLLFAEGHMFLTTITSVHVCAWGDIYATAQVWRSEDKPLALILVVI